MSWGWAKPKSSTLLEQQAKELTQPGTLESIQNTAVSTTLDSAMMALGTATDKLGDFVTPQEALETTKGPMLSPTELNKQFGIEGGLKFDEPMRLADAERKRAAYLKRTQVEDVIAKGKLNALESFGVEAVATLLNPVEAPLMFVPIANEAGAERLLTRAGMRRLASSKLATRTLVGVAEGTVGTAISEPLTAIAQEHQGKEYSFLEAGDRIALGGGIGVIGHHAIGALESIITHVQNRNFKPGTHPETRSAVLKAAVGDATEGNWSRSGDVHTVDRNAIRERAVQDVRATNHFSDIGEGADGIKPDHLKSRAEYYDLKKDAPPVPDGVKRNTEKIRINNKDHKLVFESEIDRAVYVASQKTDSPAKAEAKEYLRQHTRLISSEIEARGAEIRKKMKEIARGKPGIDIEVKKSDTTGAQSHRAAVTRAATEGRLVPGERFNEHPDLRKELGSRVDEIADNYDRRRQEFEDEVERRSKKMVEAETKRLAEKYEKGAAKIAEPDKLPEIPEDKRTPVADNKTEVDLEKTLEDMEADNKTLKDDFEKNFPEEAKVELDELAKRVDIAKKKREGILAATNCVIKNLGLL